MHLPTNRRPPLSQSSSHVRRDRSLLHYLYDKDGVVKSFATSSGSTYHKHDVSLNSDRGKQVMAQFVSMSLYESFGDTNGGVYSLHMTPLIDYSVSSIQNIEDSNRQQIFNLKVENMTAWNGIAPEIIYVVHGTSHEAVDQIGTNGISVLHGKRQQYGDGCYLSIDSAYSSDDRFSVPHDDMTTGKKYKYILLGRMAIGMVEKGAYGKHHSIREDTITYDAMVDNVSSPLMYILKDPYQVCFEYVLTFEKK